MPRRALKPHLDHLLDTYQWGYLDTDPLSFPRGYSDPEDQETAAWVSASLAYGNVRAIRSGVSGALSRLGARPAAALERASAPELFDLYRGFRYRFTSGKDVAALLWIVRQARRHHGTLERFFLEGFIPSAPTLRPALISFVDRALAQDLCVFYRRRPRPGVGIRYLLPSPGLGSACKRLNLFLRWMVRRDDGIDLGLWRSLEPRQLMVPVDTHVARIAGNLGLTRRRTPSWEMTEEITSSLRKLDPEDPVRYDFALSRLGILDVCPRRRDPMKCAACPLQTVCLL